MANKYWIANNPNSEVTDAQAQKIAADPAAAVAAIVDALDDATFTGDTCTTSDTPTVDELEACVGVLAGKINAILAALETHGIIAE